MVSDLSALRAPSAKRAALLCALVLAWSLAGAATAAPAQAACPPSGGASVPEASPLPGNFQVQGHGWGHGLGMSQYGAQGAALLGCSAEQILTTYYTGVSVGSVADNNIIVGLWPQSPSGSPAEVLNVYARDGDIPWQVFNEAGVQQSTGLSNQPAGTTRTVRVHSNGSFTVHEGSTQLWAGGGTNWRIDVPHNGKIIQLPSKGPAKDWPEGRPYRWGTLEMRSVIHAGKAWMFVNSRINSIERYLRGLAEMPSSWEPEALKAQAITGRSYAHDRRALTIKNFCRCHVYDSPSDQAYTGYVKETETGGSTNFGARWVAAVDGTTGKVLRYGGKIATGYYSSSHAGRTLSAKFVWGNDVPWIQPIDDSRWEMASPNPPNRRSWAAGFSAAEMGHRLGVGVAQRIEVLSDGVRVTGTTGTRMMTAWDFARGRPGQWQGLDLLSPVFKVNQYPIHQLVGRIGGETRIHTAVRVSTSYWKDSDHAILATAGDFPDALAAGPLAAKLGAPLMLTYPTDLPGEVASELQRLGVKTVWLLGGTAVISQAIEDQLTAAGYEVRRLAGQSRSVTASTVALEVGPSESGEVALVLADNWPDAVAAGAFAGTPDPPPTLLTGRDQIPAATLEALEELGATKILLIGGTAAVSAEVEQALKDLGYEVRRLSGPSRYDTSVAVATEALSRIGGELPIILASGANFPDALSAGALAGHLGGVLTLLPRDDLNLTVGTRGFLQSQQALKEGIIVGGSAAVSNQVQQQAEAALAK